MVVKIFWKKSCPNCPPAKELGKKLLQEGIEVEFYCLDEVNGLTEATFFGVMATPTILAVENNSVKKSWKGNVPALTEILSYA